MQLSAQEVTMLFKLIAAAKDSWACFISMLLFSRKSEFLIFSHFTIDSMLNPYFHFTTSRGSNNFILYIPLKASICLQHTKSQAFYLLYENTINIS